MVLGSLGGPVRRVIAVNVYRVSIFTSAKHHTSDQEVFQPGLRHPYRDCKAHPATSISTNDLSSRTHITILFQNHPDMLGCVIDVAEAGKLSTPHNSSAGMERASAAISPTDAECWKLLIELTTRRKQGVFSRRGPSVLVR